MKNLNLSLDYKLSQNGEKPKFTGIAKTAEPFFTNWGEFCALNFADFQQEGELVPVLFEHDRNQRIGFGRLSLNQESQNLEIEGEFLDNEEARKIIADAKQGFPFQLSVHIDAKSDRTLKKGHKEMINGLEIQGEAVILEDFLIREVSFTPTGVDEKTSAQVLSLKRKLKMENEEQKAPSAEDWAEKEQAYLDEIAELKKQIESLKEQNENLQALVGDLELEDKLKEEGIDSSKLSAEAKTLLKSASAQVRGEFLSLLKQKKVIGEAAERSKETAPNALFAETTASPKSTEQKLAEVERYAQEQREQREKKKAFI